MHELVRQLDRLARAHYTRTMVYPTHAYVGAATASRLKAAVRYELIRSDAKQMTRVDVKNLRKLTILGMLVHPRLFLADRVIVAQNELTDDQLMQDHPLALLDQLPTLT